MALTIWKSVLKAAGLQDIEVPAGAEILHAAAQHESMAVWFRCDPTAPMELRRIAVCGTGHPAPPKELSRYLGAAILSGGAYVFHIFEIIDETGAAR